MSLHRRDAARDQNEPEIVQAFKQCGWKVQRHSAWDLDVLCPRCHEILAVEIKTPPETATTPSSAGRLTKSQRALIGAGWPLQIVRTMQDVEDLLWLHRRIRCPVGSKAAVPYVSD